ncbi:unnamed protein product [Echinostoma caproni]|uniref:SET domain-containing protein n=1 Tax=Echinostoma caproni TaxID=27848 RepID=A0A183AGI4_9TREM|nr:unnamed protein product [Echinostoma caproni]
MDTLVYPPPHTLGLRLPISRRSYNQNSPVSPEPDPILEDTPDLPDERDIDYSVVPPDVGLNVLLNEVGCEISAPDTPSKFAKRALCSFSSNSTPTEEDLDDYPFHVVSYGENSSCFGLPYNDHNYALVELHCKSGGSNNASSTISSNAEHEDRLALLAKLALAKDDKQCPKSAIYAHKCSGSFNPELSRFQPDPSNLVSVSTSDFTQLSPRVLTGKSATEAFALANGLHTSSAALGSDGRTLSGGTGRALVLPAIASVSTVASSSLTSANTTLPSNAPLQVHRVTSSLTPHVVLRTGLPALQISTTVPRATYPTESPGIIRCACGYTHTDGCVVQCEKCCSWLHADCVTPANGAAIPSPYVCDRCVVTRPPPSATVTIQRHQLSNFSGSGTNGSTSIRVSRTTALGTGSASGRIFVTPAANSTNARQLHLCLPNRTHQVAPVSRPEVQVLSNTTQLNTGTARYISLVTQSTPCITQSQPLRSSKRKQDLLTLTGSSNAGLECMTSSVSGSGGSAELLETQTSEVHTTVSTDSLSTASPLGTVVAKNVYTSTPEVTGSMAKMAGSSLHRLLMQCPDQQQQQHLQQSPHQSQQQQQQSYQRRSLLQNGSEELRADGSSPSSTLSSDSIRSPPLEGYEEASDLRMSDRLFDKLDGLVSPTAPPNALSEMSTFSVDDLPPRLSAMHRCQVVCFEFNRKGLVASEDLYPQQPVVEYRGLCMLLSEYNEMYDYRKHYNPFVLFYKTWPKMALCVDARKYGNEARFIRRSCTPNCQVKHCLSITNDPISGPTPRIRLLIVANRPIMRNTELTLPFDFDFTACRYLVKCACARKGCPVARWFRQTTQADSGSHNSNLMYSRKLPTGSRGAGATSRSRGLTSSIQDNYSDILADNFDADERYGSNNWSDSRLDTETLPPVGSGGIIRPVRRRGRSRGRHRGSSVEFGLVTSRGSNKGMIKPASRGRPPGSGSRSRLQGHPRRRGMNLAGRPRIHGRYPQTDLHRLHAVDESSAESENSATDSPIKSPTNTSKSRDRRPNYVSRNEDSYVEFGVNHRWSESSAGIDAQEDDLDGDTEPECGSDRKTTTSSSQISTHSKQRTLVSPKYIPLDESDHPDKDSSSIPPSGADLMNRLERDSRKIVKSKNQTIEINERRKRRISGADGTAQSPPPRKNPIPNQGDKKKSREEIWMDEVLRRIERMEKKQQQQKQRPNATEKHEVEDTSEASGTSVVIDATAHLDNAELTKEDFDQKMSEEADASIESILEPLHEESKQSNMQVTCNPPEQSNLSQTPESNKQQQLESTEEVLCVENVSVQSNDKHSGPTPSVSLKSPLKTVDSNKNRGKQKQSGSALKNKRRRSQTPVLFESFPNAIERRDSREDRWLKSQLRRIAELEDQTVGTHKEKDHAMLDGFTNGSDTASQTDGTTFDNTKDSSHELVSDSLQSGLHTSYQETRNRRRRRQSSPGGQTSDSLEPPNSHSPLTTKPVDNGQVGGIADHSPEADCTLIVYRTREKDPMAKFSRNRKVDNSLNVTNNDQTVMTPSKDLENTPTTCSYPAMAALTPSAHSAPRPSKKRWLCQALMEEEDSNLNWKSETTPTGDPSNQKTTHSEDSILIERTNMRTPPNTSTNCPVNPKKRLISQFSGVGDDSVCIVSTSAEVTPAVLSTSDCEVASSAVKSNETITSPNEPASHPPPVSSEQMITEPCTSHSTPLPPKKATVKQQAEQLRQQEMRKVRVSLSEYRRRRGLSSTSSAANSVKPDIDGSKQTHSSVKSSAVHQLEAILPPGLVDPGLLLEELPKYYDQLRLPTPVSTESTQTAERTSPTAIRSAVDQDLESFLNKASLLRNSDNLISERGPRTPSEPPDDEDYEDADGELQATVYGRQASTPHLNSLTSNKTAGTSDGRCWSTERSPKRVVNSSSRPYSYSSYTDSKLVPVIAHSQFSRAPTRPDDRNVGLVLACNTSHTSGESRLPGACLEEVAVSHADKQVSLPYLLNVLSSSVLGALYWKVARKSSTGSPNHCSPPPPPPPPPPIRPALSVNTAVDYEISSSPVDSGPQRRLSGSDVSSTYGNVEHIPETNSLEYFIKRDQEIRHWQEARSYEWDRRRVSSGHRPPADAYSHTRHWSQKKHHWRNSAAHSPFVVHHPTRSGMDDKHSRHAASNVAGHLFDVEQTLHRLQDSLRAQLDRTRMALTPQNGTTLDRIPSFHGTGCTVGANDLVPYTTERLNFTGRLNLAEHRIHTSSSPS